jgi:hypothetical protein
VRRSTTRAAVGALAITLTLGGTVVPCAAADEAQPRTKAALTRLSPASRGLLARGVTAAQQQPESTPSSPGSFFKSKRGAVTLVLMGAGAGFTLWSIQHDRKPVKSPIR